MGVWLRACCQQRVSGARLLPLALCGEGMQIFIKTLTGRKTNFNFELDNTVRQVKEALQEKEGIQVEQIRLIYSGKQMSDECALADYSVKPGSTVHMVLQLRGGA